MKEEWKVYIKGVPDRGEEVIKVLTDLGAKSSFCQTGTFSSLIYYIKHDGIIDSVNINGEFANIIKDNYKEIELPEKKWNRGDILYSSDLGKYVVCSDFYRYGERIAYIIVSKDMIATFKDFPVHAYHLANSQEIEKFHKLLHKHRKEWNIEKRELVDWEWKPKEKETYWLIRSDGHVSSGVFGNDEYDNNAYNFGNCFKTREEAEAMAEKINKLLKGE